MTKHATVNVNISDIDAVRSVMAKAQATLGFLNSDEFEEVIYDRLMDVDWGDVTTTEKAVARWIRDDLLAALTRRTLVAKPESADDEVCPGCGYWAGGAVCGSLCGGDGQDPDAASTPLTKGAR